MPRMTTYRIGSGAGYSGDRIDPAQDLAERGALNALVFECLAERTIALAQLRRSHDPQTGYDPLLAARMHAVLPACTRQGVTIITNMGAANPLAASEAVLQITRELGLKKLRVAVVTSENPVCNAPFSGRACGMAIPSSITMAAPKSSYTVSISLTYSALQIWRLASNEPASSMASSAWEIFCFRAINVGSKIISILFS